MGCSKERTVPKNGGFPIPTFGAIRKAGGLRMFINIQFYKLNILFATIPRSVDVEQHTTINSHSLDR